MGFKPQSDTPWLLKHEFPYEGEGVPAAGGFIKVIVLMAEPSAREMNRKLNMMMVSKPIPGGDNSKSHSDQCEEDGWVEPSYACLLPPPGSCWGWLCSRGCVVSHNLR